MAPCIELTYELTRADWVAFNEAYLERDPRYRASSPAHRRAAMKTALVLAPFIIAGTTIVVGKSEPTGGMYPFGAILGMILAALILFAAPRLGAAGRAGEARLRELRSAELGDSVGPTTVRIDGHGAAFKTASREARAAWTAAGVYEVGDYFWLHFAGGGTIIPKRAFASPSDTAAFAEQTKAWWLAGQAPEAERLIRHLADCDAQCPRCRYELRGLKSDRCPECGSTISLAELVARDRPV